MNPTSTEPRIKLLLVEDDDLIRELLKQKLEKNGFTVIVSTDGTGVVDIIRSQHPDLVALDLLMPEMNGYEVLDALAKDEALRKVPVVVVSNLGQDDEIRRCKEKGAVDFLIKANYTPTQMVQKLREIYMRTSGKQADQNTPKPC